MPRELVPTVEPIHRISFEISPELHRRLDKAAESAGFTTGNFIRHVIEAAVKHVEQGAHKQKPEDIQRTAAEFVGAVRRQFEELQAQAARAQSNYTRGRF